MSNTKIDIEQYNENMSTKNNSKNNSKSKNENKEAELIFRHLTLSTKDGKILLDDINGRIEPGTMVALMGSSGAGKTTLLNSLTGRLDDNLVLKGDIRVNNRKRDATTWPNISAYVSQVFYAYENMTVEETLEFVIKILYKREDEIQHNKETNSEAHDIKTKINELLDILGLKLVKNNLVKQLSGGERIRLSVGIELVGNPSILFLDEPISGLDSFNAVKILKFLMKLAKEQRKTLIVTIHQPSYKMVQYFDKIFLMAKGGVVFDGSVKECIEFFDKNNLKLPENTNPTDFFLDEIAVFDDDSLAQVNRLKDNFRKTDMNYDCKIDNDLMSQVESFDHCCSLKLVLFDIFKRNLKDNIRNKALLFVKLIQRLSTAILFSAVYWMLGKNSPVDIYSYRGIFTFVVMNELFGICGPIFNLFKQEQQVITRERRSGMYSGYSSYVAKFMSEMVFLFFIEVPYLTLIYWLTGFFSDFVQYLQFIFILLCEISVGVTLGCTVSIVAPTLNSAQALGSTIAILFILFSGGFSNPEQLPAFLRWIIYISPVQYTFRGVLQSQSKNKTFTEGMVEMDSEALLKSFGLDGLNYTICVCMILLFAFIIGVFGAFVLHRQTRSKVNDIREVKKD